MAEQLQTGLCSGSWWTNVRSGTVRESAAAVSCSTVIDDFVGYGGWTGAAEVAKSKVRSCEQNLSVSTGNSVTFEDAQHKDAVTGAGLLIDPWLPVTAFGPSSPTTAIDWDHALLSDGERADQQSSFQTAVLQEELSSKPFFYQADSATSMANSDHNQLNVGLVSQDMSQESFKLDQHQHHLGFGNWSDETSTVMTNSFLAVSAAPYGDSSSSTFLQEDMFSNPKPLFQYGYGYGCLVGSNELQNEGASWSKFPVQLFSPTSSLPPSSPPNQQQQLGGGLHFSNENTAFWNVPAAAVINEPMRPGLFPAPVQTQTSFPHASAESKPTSTISGVTTIKPNTDEPRETSFATKRGGHETAFKKRRVEMPSPLPTFKVRKEKMSDRITALQQLVSPFGKTDTASVLYEAIEYIKLLHNQVNVLSTPYLKSGHPMQQQQRHQPSTDKSKGDEEQKEDLKSRGLCLVPLSSTLPVANEPTADFWNPTFGLPYCW